MAFLLKQIFSFFQLLNSETGHNQIASGICVGLILGFSPVISLQTILAILLLLIFRIQIGAATLSAFFFKFIAFLFDPLSDHVGRAVLESDGLKSTFIQLYNMPVIPFTRFYNSITMGSAVISICLSPFVFFISRALILKYRLKVVSKFRSTRIWKLWTGTKFYQWYSSYKEMVG
jgi:uncharacterized protein (TIGR03546 family)